MMPFTLWLITQTYRSDLVGELAQQVRRLEDWPDEATLLGFRVYLARDSATPNAQRALLLAYGEWEISREIPEVNVPVLLSHLGKLN